MRKKHNPYVGGALLLAGSNILCRILGFVYKIPLANLVGAEGLGYYSFAFQVYGLMTAVAVSGLPLTLTRAVAAAPETEQRPILRQALHLMLWIGGVGTLILMVTAGTASMLGDMPSAKFAVMALAPNAFLVSAESAYRAYFQGRADLRPGATAQIADATAKLLFGTAAAWFFYHNGYGSAVVAAGALSGVCVGTSACVIWLALTVHREDRRHLRQRKKIPGLERMLIRQALPLTLGTVVLSAMHTADAMILMNRLNSVNAAALYGAYNGLAVTVYNLPFSVTSAISATVFPVIAATRERERVHACLRRAFRLSGAVAFPVACCFAMFPTEILSLLFSRADDVAVAAPLLRMLAPAAILAAYSSLAAVALNACGQMSAPMLITVSGTAIRLMMDSVLVGIPHIGILGLPIATSACYALVCVSNLILLRRETGYGISFTECVLKPLFCGMAAAGTVSVLLRVLPLWWETRLRVLTALIPAALLGALLLRVCGLLRRDTAPDPSRQRIGKITTPRVTKNAG